MEFWWELLPRCQRMGYEEVTAAVQTCFVIMLYLLKLEILAGYTKQFGVTSLRGILAFLSMINLCRPQ